MASGALGVIAFYLLLQNGHPIPPQVAIAATMVFCCCGVAIASVLGPIRSRIKALPHPQLQPIPMDIVSTAGEPDPRRRRSQTHGARKPRSKFGKMASNLLQRLCRRVSPPRAFRRSAGVRFLGPYIGPRFREPSWKECDLRRSPIGGPYRPPLQFLLETGLPGLAVQAAAIFPKGLAPRLPVRSGRISSCNRPRASQPVGPLLTISAARCPYK